MVTITISRADHCALMFLLGAVAATIPAHEADAIRIANAISRPLPLPMGDPTNRA